MAREWRRKMDKSSSTSISILDVLQIVFIVLKLCKVINWSWWWVLSPIWITAIIVIVFTTIRAIILKGKKR